MQRFLLTLIVMMHIPAGLAHAAAIGRAMPAHPAQTRAPHPAETAAPHPALAAHANATAAHAAAARIETCTAAARALFKHLAHDDLKAAIAQFNATARPDVEAGKLNRAWASLADHYGKFEATGVPQNMLYRGLAIIAIPLQFANGDLAAHLTCDPDGRLAGLQIRPVALTSPATLPK